MNFEGLRALDQALAETLSDDPIVQGLIAIMMRVYSGKKPEDIIATPPDFLHEIGLDEHLSPTRKNGLASMVTAIMTSAQNAAKG